MTEGNTNPTGDNAQNQQDSSTPKPSPTPTPPANLDKSQDPTPTSRHSASDEPAAEENTQDPTQDQAYLDKHASLTNRDGEGSPGDISGYATSTEDPGAHPADFSSVTGRDQVANSER